MVVELTFRSASAVLSIFPLPSRLQLAGILPKVSKSRSLVGLKGLLAMTIKYKSVKTDLKVRTT